jgi:V8-like Glu-specific endopeptidase
MNKATLLFKSLSLIILFLFSTINIFAQRAEIPMHTERIAVHSGYFSGDINSTEAQLAYSQTVGISEVPWLHIHFANYNLGSASYITITSQLDGAAQIHNQITLEQWEGLSAYFNGDYVDIKLYVAPQDQNVFFRIEEITVGEWNGQTDSQCGPTDDRIESNDPRAGRLMNLGCTTWLIPNGKMVTAGHCISGTIVQFNVPLSLPNGTIQHPGPEDQYSVITASRVFQDAGVGNDWGVFAVNPNTVTTLMPSVAQGSVYFLQQNYAIGDSIRITGYGVDNNTPIYNQAQQTHIGPNAGSSGTTMRYRTDTEGGNSGSPIIHGVTDVALGVHSHGGCTTAGTGNNNGTSFFHTNFWNAVDQGIPVELTALNAAVDYNSVTITWTTATELNNKGFSVERKLKYENSWNELGFVAGNGTTTNIHNYFFIDAGIDANTYIYRLKQIDFDGTMSYSSEVEVEVTGISDYSLYQNYPNPFNPATTIKFRLAEKSFVTLKVYDQLGSEVDVLLNGELPAGEQIVQFNTEGKNLASGIYFYQLTTDKKSDVRKMILMK